ncbi:MAG: hypothetical protein K8I03_05700 [Ignavibacteria bacterium]|nr:hypothetical protein [Ignavibacteria bacterium]
MFASELFEEMKKFFNENSKLPKGKKMVCIVTLNHGIKLLYGDMKMKLGSQIDHTMNKLVELNKISKTEVIEFNDKNGKITTGVTEPEALSKSVYIEIMNMIGENMGCFVFGLSIMDGYHSVTILVDKSVEKNEIFRCDQNEGCFKSNEKELDAYITSKTIKWWNNKAKEGTKMKTRATIWMLQ